jgi:hypothetical protein
MKKVTVITITFTFFNGFVAKKVMATSRHLLHWFCCKEDDGNKFSLASSFFFSSSLVLCCKED